MVDGLLIEKRFYSLSSTGLHCSEKCTSEFLETLAIVIKCLERVKRIQEDKRFFEHFGINAKEE